MTPTIRHSGGYFKLLPRHIWHSFLVAADAVPAEIGAWLPAEVGESILIYFMIDITLIVVAVPEGLPMSVTLSLAYITFIAVLILYIRHITPDGAEASVHDVTVLFTGFVMLQFWNLFNARVYGTANSFLKGLFGNKAFLLIAAVILVGQIVAVQFGGNIFRTEPLSLMEWLAIAGCTLPVLVIGEIVRFIARCKGKNNG